MKAQLLHYSPMQPVVEAIRTCWKTQEKSDTMGNNVGPNDQNLIRRIIKHGHTSTLEHSILIFKLTGISRALLQELSRHRVGVSPSVESTRYTFKRILNSEGNIDDFLVSSGDDDIDELNNQHMNNLKELINRKGLHNDMSKYGIVESYIVNEIVSFNVRSFRHFYQLRSSKKALKEIQNLASILYSLTPKEYSVFFEDLMEKE